MLALLAEMTMGGKTLYASDRSRRQGSVRMRFHICRADGSDYSNVVASVAWGLEARELIERAISMPHEMSWGYCVTEAGSAALRAAMARDDLREERDTAMTKRTLMQVARQIGDQDLRDLAEYSMNDEQRERLALSEMARFVREGRHADAYTLGRALYPDTPLERLVASLPR